MSPGYTLGVDLGTTYTCAAVTDRGSSRVVQLTGTSQTIPSVVSISGGDAIAGEAAERRLVSHPSDTAREFKRRFGDPAPLVLGGTPHSAEVVTAHLLREVLRRVEQAEGARPSAVGLAHPASWGPFRLDLLRETARLADVEHVELVPEPVAAAVANRDRVEEGSLVAVYDLGGGTFDAAVVKCAGEWSVVGTPEGVERLGGVDFDQAIMAHVDEALGGQVYALDMSDPDARSALMQLRAECQRAKEHLSQDTDVEIPVSLPNLRTAVRLTRSEFEAMVRPRLADSLAVLDRVVASAGASWEDIAQVLLVGGSSNIPAVGQAVSEHTGRPVMTATNPHLAIAIGTAAVTAQRLAAATPADASPAGTEGPPASGPEEPAVVRTSAPTKRKPIGVIVGAVVALVALVFGGVALLGGDDEQADDRSQPTDPAPATSSGSSDPTVEPLPTDPGTGTENPTSDRPSDLASCSQSADGVSAITIADGSMYLATEAGVVTHGSLVGCELDPDDAVPAGFDWSEPVTNLDETGDRVALAGPNGGALAIAGRPDVIGCAALTGVIAAASDEQLFVVRDDGLNEVSFEGGACTTTVFVPASETTVTALDATRNRLVAGGLDPDGRPTVRMWIRGREVLVAGDIEFGSVDAVEGCGDATCVFDVTNRLVHRIGEDGALVERLALPEQPSPITAIIDTGSDSGVPYLVASFADSTTHILRLDI